MSRHCSVALVSLLAGACSVSHAEMDAGEESMDARVTADAAAPDTGPERRDAGDTPPSDAGAAPDGGPIADPDAGTEADGGASMDDAGESDAGVGDPDGGFWPDGSTRPPATMCDPTTGIECDGDWEGRCTPACSASKCCAPRNGRFECVNRVDGACPAAADIWVDTSHIETGYRVGWREFESAGCEFEEGCVDAPGWRRLLFFDTWTPNTGTADLYLGRPADNPDLFEYSTCHAHFHFNSYARYELRDMTGAIVARGHKQAFCLLDFYRYPEGDTRGLVYTCSNQGIQMGFQDVYGSHLDCQWVDVTEVPPGEYVLRIDINYEGVLLESDYTNNTAEVVVTIPPDSYDVTAACPAGTAAGADRNCGFTMEAPIACTPGATVEVGCAEACGVGSCTGDAILRVCEPSAGTDCQGRRLLASNDDHGCGGPRCGGSGGGAAGCCPHVSLTCPASGQLVPFWGPYNPTGTATCSVASSP